MRWKDQVRNVLESFAFDRVDELIIDEEAEGECTFALESIRAHAEPGRIMDRAREGRK